MASKNRTTLKGYFETGDTPSQAQYADLIDSNLNLSETTDQTTAGGLNITGNVTSSGNISASGAYPGIEANGGIMHNVITFDPDKGIWFVNSNQAITGNGNSITIESDDYLYVNSDNYSKFTTPELRVTGYISGSSLISETHITASGNISASGNIISSQITSSGGILNKGNLFQEKSIALNQDKPLQSKSGSSYVDLIRLNPNNTILVGNSAANNIANQTELFTFASFKFKVNPSYAYSPASAGTGGEIVRISGGFGEPTGLYVHGAISASRTITGNNLNLDGSQVDFTNLPTSDPNVAGRLYNDGGSLKISAG